jgi:phosphopantothenoylcysteine decarboxylase / phosphopantothenate---cysteine ligase
MSSLLNKKILLIICGGISAYKSLEVIRLLNKRGAQVKTILTKSSKEFITPLSVSSLSKEKVYDDMFVPANEGEMDHISLSRWSDIILVAPATANTISKLSSGSSDDLASTVMLASNKDIFLTPAMNVRMWEHPATKENLSKLKKFGYKIIGPEIGDMACGEFGEGKMTEPDEIIKKIEIYFINLKKNKKFKALVTAGPTHEYIDPVRYITNRSSGKQGFEIANSLSKKGFQTTLISGPTNLKADESINFIEVQTAEQMFKATQNNLPVDVAIFSAAVADFKIREKKEQKIKKKDYLNLNLEENIDILNYVSNHNSQRPKIVIGFAAETNNLKLNAERKLLEKSCDWVIANDVSDKSIGFNSDFNEVTIFYKNKNMNEEKLVKKRKSEISDEIIERVINQLN